MSKPRLRLAFTNFWPGFDPANNYFTGLLGRRFAIELSDRPDLLIFSGFGDPADYRRHNCLRVFFTGENRRADFAACDYAFGFDYRDHPRYFRLPLYAICADPAVAIKRGIDPARILAGKTGFCNFVYSNPLGFERNRFFRKLSRYKPVDSGGVLFNNIGGPVKDKVAFLRRYKFTIAFENERYPGYTTEKIFEPMLADSLPIYWGNPLVGRDFNTRSFLNFDDYGSDEALIERIIELDRDDRLYAEYVRQPWFNDNEVNEFVDPDNVLARFEMIVATPRVPIAQRGRVLRFFFLDRLSNTPDKVRRHTLRWWRQKRAALEAR